MPSEDGWMDPAMKAAHSSALEPNTDPTSYEAGIIGPSDSTPATGCEPRMSVPAKSDLAPIMEFTSTDIGHEIQASKSNLMARGVAIDLL